MMTKLANQSTLAPIAAARPRTAVGKTSPWISQPVPPTPIANEVMKKEKPTMMTQRRGNPVRWATPHAANRMKTAMPDVTRDGRNFSATHAVDEAEGEVRRDHVDRTQYGRGLDSSDGSIDCGRALTGSRRPTVATVQ